MHIHPLLAFCFIPIALTNCAAAPLPSVSMPALAPAAAAPDEDPRFREGLAAFRLQDDVGSGDSGGDSGGDGSGGWIWASDEFADWVLAGVTLTDGRGNERVWFVRLSTPISTNDGSPNIEEFTVPAQMGPLRRGAKISAPANRVRIESFDHRGRLLNSSNRTIPGGEIDEAGFEALGRFLAAEQHEESSAEDLAKLAIAIQQIGRAGALRPIRNEARKSVIREPNILMLILNAWRLSIRADFANAELLAEPWVALPGLVDLPQYTASSPMYIAGQHVVNTQVVLAPITGPSALTAGLLGFEMTHPDRPQSRLTVKIIATKPREADRSATGIPGL